MFRHPSVNNIPLTTLFSTIISQTNTAVKKSKNIDSVNSPWLDFYKKAIHDIGGYKHFRSVSHTFHCYIIVLSSPVTYS